MAFAEVAVLVPTIARDAGAGDFDEAHAAFDEASGEQALAGVDAGGFEIGFESVGLEGGRGFALELHQVGHFGLHPEGEFLIGDGGLDGIGAVGAAKEAMVETADEVEFAGLQLGGAFEGSDIGDAVIAGFEDGSW
jgi:hypothetical protein